MVGVVPDQALGLLRGGDQGLGLRLGEPAVLRPFLNVERARRDVGHPDDRIEGRHGRVVVARWGRHQDGYLQLAAFDSGKRGSPDGAEADTRETEPVGVDLRPRGEPVDQPAELAHLEDDLGDRFLVCRRHGIQLGIVDQQ